MNTGEVTLHATAIVLGEHGVLIRGASGSGKSALARDLIRRAASAARFARLVGDDRVSVSARARRLLARPVPAIAGRIELRGLGIVSVPFEPACVLRLVIDLTDEPPARMPEPDALTTTLLGIEIPRLAAERGAAAFVWDAIVCRLA